MKPGFLIFLSILLVATSTTNATCIESIVYDLKIDRGELTGFCLIKGESEEVGELVFSSPVDFEALEVDAGIDGRIISIQDNISGHDIELPLLSFPCKVKKTLIAVHLSDGKFLWRTGFPTIPVEEDRALMQSGMDTGAIFQLDSDFWDLRRHLSKSAEPPRYRLYLGQIDPGEKVTVKAWLGEVYEYYLPYATLALVLCGALLSTLYLILGRL